MFAIKTPTEPKQANDGSNDNTTQDNNGILKKSRVQDPNYLMGLSGSTPGRKGYLTPMGEDNTESLTKDYIPTEDNSHAEEKYNIKQDINRHTNGDELSHKIMKKRNSIRGLDRWGRKKKDILGLDRWGRKKKDILGLDHWGRKKKDILGLERWGRKKKDILGLDRWGKKKKDIFGPALWGRRKKDMPTILGVDRWGRKKKEWPTITGLDQWRRRKKELPAILGLDRWGRRKKDIPTILGLDRWGRKKKGQLKEARSKGMNSVRRPIISWQNKTGALNHGRDKKRKIRELGGQKKKESPYLRGEMWFLSRRQHRYKQSNWVYF